MVNEIHWIFFPSFALDDAYVSGAHFNSQSTSKAKNWSNYKTIFFFLLD